jgi:2-polyprenyl-3-methyl-5-hydroxy-6-metoxy-1,4-benzoquinol methylase
MAFPSDPDVSAYYGRGGERNRLESPQGRLEFTRTKEILRRHLPSPPATLADVGGGAGSYSVWLAKEGYRVLLRDLMPLHIDQAIEGATDEGVKLDVAVCDARALDIGTDEVDAVLLLGPLYHLPDRDDRIKALSEALRIARPGAPVFVAAISRWAPLLDGLAQRLYRDYPDATALLDQVIDTGVLAPLFPGSFTGFCHRPDELVAETIEAGLECVDLVTVEGLAFAFPDLAERWGDPVDQEAVLDAVRRIERAEELMGLGPHLLLTARK